jgi:hypothetical protein
MAKLVGAAVFAALLAAAFGGRASATVTVPGAASSFGCGVNLNGTTVAFDGGFSGASGSCSVPGARASLSSDPVVLFQASSDAGGPGGVPSALATFDYFYTLTGGAPDDKVPVLIHLVMSASSGPSNDPMHATVGEADVLVFRPGVHNDANANVCSFHPVACGQPDFFDGNLSLTMTPGTTEKIHMQLTTANGGSASIDPFIFVDPSFANAGLYTITLSPGVGNGVAGVPEPATWAMLIGGLALTGAMVRRRRGRLPVRVPAG